MKTILLPTDFSKNSINAINYALELYKNVPCVFYVLHVFKTSAIISDDLMVSNASATLYEAVIDTTKKKMVRFISELKLNYNNEKHQFKSVVDYDNFIDSINQVTNLYKVDLIIMGTKGASGLQKVLFGSNTIKVIKRCAAPVLAVPAHFEYSKLKNIAYTTSFKRHYKKKELAILNHFISLENSRLYIIHALFENEIPEDLVSSEDFFKLNFNQPLFEYLKLKNKTVYKSIYEFTKTNNINLLALSGSNYSFFERLFVKHTIDNVAFSMDIPFLIIKSPISKS